MLVEVDLDVIIFEEQMQPELVVQVEVDQEVIMDLELLEHQQFPELLEQQILVEEEVVEIIPDLVEQEDPEL